MNILICDDDKNIISSINNFLLIYAHENNLQFSISSFSNPMDIVCDVITYDIVFIDIEMPQMSGLSLTKYLQDKNPNIVVFIVTSFQGYLDDAMDLNVFRYISKPIDKNRFFKSLDVAINLYLQTTDKIIIEYKGQFIQLLTIDILFLSIDKRNTLITTKDSIYISNKKFDYWKKYLNQYNYFSQPHYSYIVNLKHVTNFDRSKVTITYDTDKITYTPISRGFYNLFKIKFYDYMGGTV